MKDCFIENIDYTVEVKVKVKGVNPFTMEIKIASGAELAGLVNNGKDPSINQLLDFLADHLVSWSLPIPADRESLEKRIIEPEVFSRITELITDNTEREKAIKN